MKYKLEYLIRDYNDDDEEDDDDYDDDDDDVLLWCFEMQHFIKKTISNQQNFKNKRYRVLRKQKSLKRRQ